MRPHVKHIDEEARLGLYVVVRKQKKRGIKMYSISTLGRIFTILGLTLAVSLASAKFSVAQTDDSSASADTGFVLDEVIVTATKRSESLQTVGVSVSAFSQEALERLNPSDSNEVLLQVPNLSINANAGSTNANIFLRGVGSTGISFNLQSGVGVYSDEVVLNSPVVNILQLYDLERVEVLRGPQNTLYGRNTTGGAINFISRKPVVGGDANGYLTSTYGRFNQFDLEGAYGAPIGDSAAFRASATYQTRDGIRRNLLTGNDDVNRNKFAARAQLAFEPSENITANLKGHIERVRSDNIRYKTLGGFDPNNPALPCPTPEVFGACVDGNGFRDSANLREISSNLADPRNDVDAGGVSLQVNIDFDKFVVTSISAYEENNQLLSEDSDGSPASGFHFFLDNEQNQISQEIRVASNTDKPLSWIVGGYYFSENVSGQTGPLFGTPMGTMVVQSFAEFDNTTLSAYGEAEYQLSDKIALKGGIRYGSDNIKGRAAALLAFPGFLPGVDLDASLLGGNPLPSFDELADIATANGIGVFTGGAVGGGPNRLILVGGDTDPTAQINDTTFNNWGATLGAEFTPADDVLVYAKWSRGFKAGRFNAAPMSIMNLDSVTGRSLGDTPIRPETINAYEFGFKTKFADNRARLNAAVFFNDYKDQQINQSIAGQFVVINVDSKIYGGEVELNLLPFEGGFIDFGAGYLSNKTQNPNANPLIGAKLPQAPSLTANLAVRREWDLDNGSVLSIGADGRYTGSRFFNLANVTQDKAYFVTNAQISYTFGRDNHIRAALWGKNIFDEVYFLSRSTGLGAGADTVLLSDPATFGVTMTYKMK